MSESCLSLQGFKEILMPHKTFGFVFLLAIFSCAGAVGQTRATGLSSFPVAAQRTILDALSQDMPWLQLAELTASDGASTDQFGLSVTIDGNTVVVGAPYANVGSNQGQGAAYVFVKPATGWENMTQVAKLTASDGKSDDFFGGSVAISGKTVLVGNTNFNGGGGYLFVRPKHGWKTRTETARLSCGWIGAISTDIVVCTGGLGALVYVKPKSGWKSTYQYDAELIPTDGNNNFSSVSTNGNVIVAGADNIGGEGAAYVFVKPKAGWGFPSNVRRIQTETAKLTASDSVVDDLFGQSVSVSGDTVAVGAPQAISNPPIQGGAAYVFVKPASGWANMTETAKLTADTTDQDSTLGKSVAVRAGTLVAGNPSGSIANNLEGEAYVFLKPANGWVTTSTFDARLTPSATQRFDQFGGAVAISGQTILVGDTHFEVMQPGAAYVFGADPAEELPTLFH
jgi:hypothetical protein